MIEPSEQALNSFEEAVKWPMLALSVAIIPLLLIPLVVQLSPAERTVFTVADWAVWTLFAAEYFVRLYLSPRRRHFVTHNLLDLALVLVPFLRPLRAMRSLRALRLLRLTVALLFVGRGIKASRRALMRHGLAYVLLVAILIIVAGVIIIHEVEPGHPGSKIQGWGDATVWTVETIATAGSETPWPASGTGQFLRVVLVLLGLSLFGLITASLASWFVEVEDEKHDKERQQKLEARLDRLQVTLDALVAERRAEGTAVGPTPIDPRLPS
jgi:voltage-gated potassium channel